MSSPICRSGSGIDRRAERRRDSSPRGRKKMTTPGLRRDTSVMTKTRLRAWGPVVSLLLISCSTSAQPAKRVAPGDVVATVGSTSITLAEVDDKALQAPASSFGEVKLVQ